MKKKFIVRLFIATILRRIRIFILNIRGYSLPYSVIIEGNVKLDKLNRKGIVIGSNTLIASGCSILSHDHCKRVGDNEPYLLNTTIGENCFLGVDCVILPGVNIGDQVIIGAGSVVTKNIPSNTVAVGNPAKIIRKNIKMNNFAALENWSIEKGWF